MTASRGQGKLRRVVATAGLWLVLVASAAAQDAPPPPASNTPPREPAVTWGGEMDVVSQYVWRGLPYSQGMVVWPTAWISTHGVTATLFLNYDRRWDPTWNEYDLTFTYERAIGRWTLAGTFTRYVYYEGDQRAATSEIIGRTEFAAGPGKIFTTHAFDVEKYKGSYYLEAGYAFERELDAKSTLSADASIAFWSAFIDKYTEGTANHITDGIVGPLTLNASYLRTLAPGVAVRPHVSFMRIGDAKGRQLLQPPGATVGVALVLGR